MPSDAAAPRPCLPTGPQPKRAARPVAVHLASAHGCSMAMAARLRFTPFIVARKQSTAQACIPAHYAGAPLRCNLSQHIQMLPARPPFCALCFGGWSRRSSTSLAMYSGDCVRLR